MLRRRPEFDVKESLTDPSRDEGTGSLGGSMPIRRGVPDDSAEGPEDSSELTEEDEQHR